MNIINIVFTQRLDSSLVFEDVGQIGHRRLSASCQRLGREGHRVSSVPIAVHQMTTAFEKNSNTN
jgi:hypothetical protein